MRLAYLSTDPGIPYGGWKGASVHVAEVVAALAAEDTELLLLVAAVSPGMRPVAGVAVEELPHVGKGVSAGERVASQGRLADWLTRRLEAFAPTALYERLALHSEAGAQAASRLGIPHLVEIDAPLPDEAARFRTLEEPEAADRLEAATLTNAAIVFAVSPPLAQYAQERGARRVEVLQNAARLHRPPRRRPRDLDPVAVFCGTLRPWHGAETIAAAWRRLGPAAPRLLIVGDGPARRSFDGLPARMLGAVAPARVPALLAGAEIGLAPYGVDTPRYFSPIKLFEYLAAGLATIVADLPAVTAVVDGESALVIPAGDEVALADGVSTLRSDPDRRRRLGENGRALIEAGHTWGHRARRIREAVDELSVSWAPR